MQGDERGIVFVEYDIAQIQPESYPSNCIYTCEQKYKLWNIVFANCNINLTLHLN